ncbi:hypothetical protein P152DRAFT_510985 [Eremomyces bilateralis CBS 781.70]|uniref:Uncharacterized protein n=1 Tax=Eremomyces bilateralis CBS 781.70 TaxID=1392243 RepID=A0A6G1GDR9_9PEZI|nr:uncharacterized protein P152DRAFT_510985 [Eremomyces bilateralis CBS 781.70]KAF1816172.1 hypothetical protein P152DRAFT_510985 [Eremomyces bilateralis CBS 781.70]
MSTMGDDGDVDHKRFARPKWLTKPTHKSASKEKGRPGDIPQPFYTSASNQLSDDVQDFLKPSTTKARSFAPKLAPKIDIAAAQRYPTANDVNTSRTPSSIKGRSARNRARLNVAWDDGALEIMGYGGDDCDEPTMAISKSKARDVGARNAAKKPEPRWEPPPVRMSLEDHTLRPTRGNVSEPVGNSGDLERSNTLPPNQRSSWAIVPPSLTVSTTVGADDDDDDFQPKPLQRAPTGWSDYLEEEDDLPAKSPKSPISPTQVLQQRMRQEEGRILHQVRRSQLLELPDDLSDLSLGDALGPSGTSATQPKQPPAPGPKPDKYAGKSTREEKRSSASPLREPTLPRIESHDAPSSGSDFSASKHPEPRNIPPPPTRYLSADAVPVQPHPRTGPPPAGSYTTPSPNFHARLSPGYREEYQTPPGPFPLSINEPHPPSVDPQARTASRPSADRPPSRPPRSPGLIQTQNHPPNSLPYFSAAKIDQEEALSQLTPDSVKNPTSATADMSLIDFADRIGHMRRIFPLTAERESPIAQFTAKQWLRAAVWWFLRARQRFEELIRARAKAQHSLDSPGTQQLDQGHVDLGKTFWILEDVLPSHKQLQDYMSVDDDSQKAAAQAAGDQYAAGIFSEASTLRGQMKLLASSMTRNKLMPPHEVLIQGLDQLIWIRYPKLPFPEIPAVAMSCIGHDLLPFDDARVLFTMTVADTHEYFCLHRCFVLVTIDPDYMQDVEIKKMPALLTILRRRGTHDMKLTLATQNDTINFIYEDKLPWDDIVALNRSRPEMRIALPSPWPNDTYLMIALNPSDFTTIRKAYDSTYAAATAIEQQRNETLLYQGILREFYFKFLQGPAHQNGPQSHPPERPSIYNFPSGAFPSTSIHIFGVYTRRPVHSGGYRSESLSGFRVVITTTGYKSMNTLTLTFPATQPEHLGSYMDASGFPVLVMFHYGPAQTRGDLVLSFRSVQEREQLLEVMRGFYIQPGEQVLAELPLDSFDLEEVESRKRYPASGQPPWSKLSIIQTIKPDRSTYLRIVFNSAAQGYRITLTDRFTNQSSQLKFRIATDLEPRIEFLRSDPHDLSCTIERTDPSTKVGPEWSQLLHATESPTIRSYTFSTMSDLHTLESILTGFTVKYDCSPQSFTLSRSRRSALSLTRTPKSSSTTRLQILEQLHSPTHPPLTLLLAFFASWPQAPYLAIPLRPSDAFERLDPSRLALASATTTSASAPGKFAIKFPDAKFGFPTTRSKPRSRDPSPRNSVDHRPDTATSDGSPALAGSLLSAGGGRGKRESVLLDGLSSAWKEGGFAGRYDTGGTAGQGAGEAEVGYVNLADLPFAAEREEVVVGFAGSEERGRLWAALPRMGGEVGVGAEEEYGGRYGGKERDKERQKKQSKVLRKKEDEEEEGKGRHGRFWRREKE